MRNLKLSLCLSALALSACNSIELGYVPISVPTPEIDAMAGLCTYPAAGAPFSNLALDTLYDSRVELAVSVSNTLDPLSIPLDPMTPGDQLNYPRSITPLRFDFRWECESQGFQGDVGPLILPAFSTDLTRPFCVNNRDEAIKDFAGFDVVPATGGGVLPGETGVIHFTPVPSSLGLAIREFFSLSVQAEACCAAVGGCNNLANARGQAACDQLQILFDQYSGGNNQLDVTQLSDVNRFRPFYTFTEGSPANDVYPMRLSGFFEGVLPDGDLITSSQFNYEIGFCYGGCGSPPGTMPTAGDCYTR